MTELPASIFKGIDEGTLAYEYRGIKCCKNPIDLAIIMRLLWDVKPGTIIEVGAAAGGSALFMRDMMRNYGEECEIHAVDIRATSTIQGNLHFYKGDGRDLWATFADQFMENIQRPLVIFEDADHFPETTQAVLAFFDRWSRPGEYIVVEDTEAEKFYPGLYHGGPIAAIKAFLDEHCGTYEVDRSYCDMFGLTFNPDGYIRRVK